MALNILLICTAFNGLTQRSWGELRAHGHQVELHVAADGDPQAMRAAVARHRPQLVVAPMLKAAIPQDIWQHHVCLIIHPGIEGDRGPSSLDWALLDQETRWGVTVLQAAAEMDAGDVWASVEFNTRAISKSQLYRHEVADAALAALLLAVKRFEGGVFRPTPLSRRMAEGARGRLRPGIKLADRAVDWSMDSAEILRRIRSADSFPGASAQIMDLDCRLFGAQSDPQRRGRPGELLAQHEGAVCVASNDGAVWISHLRANPGFKLPADRVLGAQRMDNIPHADTVPVACQQIRYREHNEIGYLHFDFYNGAMSTEQCLRLREAWMLARQRPTRTLVLMGGQDIWSNGIHLNTIEAAPDPAQESWRNIQAMNALVREIILTDSHRVVAAMQGNAGAGGAVLALAADVVWAREGVVLNPHYKSMGGLYGSEYWTYLLPRRVGEAQAQALTEELLPVVATTAQSMGLIDACMGQGVQDFCQQVQLHAEAGNSPKQIRHLLELKRKRRQADEQERPLESYASEELAQMQRNFFGPDPSYHEARHRFVLKCQASKTDTPMPAVTRPQDSLAVNG